jgi:hypothetical protein
LSPNTTFFYRVSATNSAGTSALSTVVSARTTATGATGVYIWNTSPYANDPITLVRIIRTDNVIVHSTTNRINQGSFQSFTNLPTGIVLRVYVEDGPGYNNFFNSPTFTLSPGGTRTLVFNGRTLTLQ